MPAENIFLSHKHFLYILNDIFVSAVGLAPTTVGFHDHEYPNPLSDASTNCFLRKQAFHYRRTKHFNAFQVDRSTSFHECQKCIPRIPKKACYFCECGKAFLWPKSHSLRDNKITAACACFWYRPALRLL